MFGNIALDIFIGFVFIFLLYSLLATILQELIARWFNLRSRMLLRSIRRMLEDHVHDRSKAWQRSTLVSYFFEVGENLSRYLKPIRKHEKTIQRFYDHPSVKYLGEDKANSKPSYLQPHNFAYTIVQLLRGSTYDGSTQNEAVLIKNTLDNNLLNINSETLTHLQHLFADARQDVHLFRQRLEQWFDETMQRTNGWYKKQSQLMLIFLGLFIAYVFNVDSIAIYKILATNKSAREQLVKMAIDSQQPYRQRVMIVQQGTSPESDSNLRDTAREALLRKTYDAIATDASRANEILGLGRPWSDSITSLKEMLAAEKNNTDTARKAVRLQRATIAQLSSRFRTLHLNNSQADKTLLRDSLNNELNSINSRISRIKQSLYIQQALQEKLSYYRALKKKYWFKASPNQQGGLTTLIGWMLTALAISLGAPFWFDLLSRFVQMRTAGQRVPAGKPVSGIAGTSSVNSVVTPDNKTIRG